MGFEFRHVFKELKRESGRESIVKSHGNVSRRKPGNTTENFCQGWALRKAGARQVEQLSQSRPGTPVQGQWSPAPPGEGTSPRTLQ